jgi:hypothetical protein
MEIPRMSLQEVADHVRRGEQVVFLDARSQSAYEKGTVTIPGSIRVPPTETDDHLAGTPRGAALYVACCT